MTIFPKQVVALVGESGCGKTTLANLMAGNISPTKGKIFFDHVDAKDINSSILRSQIGFIQQNNELFAGTIESNATYNYSYVDEIKLNSCFTEAHCHEFIEKFPTGSKQYLAEGGMGLSGGQKQRLCIARTLYQNPKILIMDEATSALDSESEALLMDNLKKLAANRTTILIAHRLSTIRYADHILVIDQGELVEAGHHEELVAKKGVYYQLFKEQMR
jgi:ATP-binding cassette subfamily B protein